MRIAIDAGPLLGQGGISGYVDPLVRHLVAADGASDYRFVLRRGWRGRGTSGELKSMVPVVELRVPDRVLSLWWERWARPFPLHRDLWRSIDLFLATCLMAPVLPAGRVVSIVYDLTPLRLPALFPDRDRFRRRLESIARSSAALVAISHRTRTDLIELLGVEASRVQVIYPGRGDAFRPPSPEVAADTAQRYGIQGPYVLYVGSLGPHKNVAALLEAYERARLHEHLAARLVLVGSHRWGGATLAALKRLRVRDDVVLTGSVPASDLPSLYGGAVCFVFPSRYEGFGLPVLEAMACGTPVIASRCGALPEVVGEAGLLVDPEDRSGLAAAICQVAGDPALRANLAARSLSRAAEFSWARSAAELLGLFRSVAAERHSDA